MSKNGVQGALESKLQQRTCKMVTRFFQNLKVRKKSFRMVCSKLKSDTPTLLWLPRKSGEFCMLGSHSDFLQQISNPAPKSHSGCKKYRNIENVVFDGTIVLQAPRIKQLRGPECQGLPRFDTQMISRRGENSYLSVCLDEGLAKGMEHLSTKNQRIFPPPRNHLCVESG